MNDERFFDLAIKVIGQQATDTEHAELDAIISKEPARRAEFERLQADACLAKGILLLMDATNSVSGSLPAYARGRLQTKVRQTFSHPAAKQDPNRSLKWGWRWIFGLAVATALIILVALPTFRSRSGPIVQVAMLDTVGVVRGTENTETEIFKQQWENSTVEKFDQTVPLQNWETNWPTGDKLMAKVVYDRAVGEVRVFLHKGNKTQQKTFVIEQDLATTLKLVADFIRTQPE